MCKQRLNVRFLRAWFVQWSQEYTKGLEDFRSEGTANKKSNKEEGGPGVLGVRCSSNTMVCINTFLANANSLITSNSFSSENQTGFLKFL